MGGVEGGAPRGPAVLLLLASLLLAAIFAPAGAAQSLPLSPSAGTTAASPDPASLALWKDRAAAALDKGDYAAARDIAAAALEAAGLDSDLRYLLARAGLSLDGLVRPALAETQAALASDSFFRYSRDEALAFEAGLLLRLKRPEEALGLLEGLGQGRRADLDLARIGALFALGRPAEALVCLEAARLSWPEDLRFARLFFASWKTPPQDRSRRLADAYLRLALDPDHGEPSLLPLALPFAGDQRAAKRALAAFRALRGPLDPLDSLRYGLIDEGRAVEDYFAAGAVLDRSSLETLASLLDPSGLQVLEARLAAFTGSLESDADGDGFMDSRTSYAAGRLLEWRRDADQDGRAELVLTYRFGEASSASWETEEGGFGYRWASWPELGSAWSLPAAADPALPAMVRGQPVSAAGQDRQPDPAFSVAQGRPGLPSTPPPRSWELGPGLLSWAPVRELPFPGPGSDFSLVDATGAPPPLPRALLAAASRLSLERDDGVLLVELRQGLAQSAELRSGDRLVARISYRNGRPQLEELDQDGDGRFESRLLLDPASDPADPLVLAFSSDLDGDGIYEYREEVQAPYRKTWDLEGLSLPRRD